MTTVLPRTAGPGGPLRRPGTRRPVRILALVLVAVLAAGAGCLPGGDPQPVGLPGSAPPGLAAGSARTLVLYDSTGPYARLGELYAIQMANLASRFGSWKAHPISRFTAGEHRGYTAVIYIGSTYDEPLPAAFLDAVAAQQTPVLWLHNNIWQLTARHPQAIARYGVRLEGFDEAPVAQVRYRGTALTRDTAAGSLMRIAITDPAKATAVGESVLADGSLRPWGVRAGKLTYLGEMPLTFTTSNDRYLALADLMFDLLAPGTPERHQALVRIEDVGPQSDPEQLRAIGDYLYERRVPFSVAVFVQYDDPAGRYSGGKPVHRPLSETPKVVEALRYLVERGGTLLMHGYTHGYAGAPNPYGVSAEDFEFYRAHVDATNKVVLDGPVPEDSAQWATSRLTAARVQWAAAGLPAPRIFEFPHYAASAVDYRAVAADADIDARYERAMYYTGLLSGGAVDTARPVSQYFPYPVRDVYGTPVIPETLGNVSSQRYNQHGVRLPADILDSAKRQLVVRDGVTSFFYHPFLGMQYLPTLVEGIQALGYTFVAPQALILE